MFEGIRRMLTVDSVTSYGQLVRGGEGRGGGGEGGGEGRGGREGESRGEGREEGRGRGVVKL